MINPNICARILTLKKRTLIKGGRRLTRGGSRPGAGRTHIDGKGIKIKVPDKVMEQLDLFFSGKTMQERIRDCLEFGISQMNSNHRNLIDESCQPNVIDLFSGAGGLSRGFQDAGFNVRLGIDFDDAALKTFKENHGDADVMKLDLFNHDNLKYVLDYLDKNKIKVDVLVGGPPCQGYSLAGPRNEHDKRNTLYEAMVKLAGLVKPKAVVLENVPGLVRLFDGKAAKRIVEDFTELGYNMQYKQLYAPEYGVPQIRKRVFFVGVLKNFGEFEYPKPMLSPDEFITCKDAIGDLPSLEHDLGTEEADYTMPAMTEYQKVMRKNSKKLMNHVGTQHSPKTVKLISMVPEGKNYKSLPAPYNTMFKYHEALTRYDSHKPSLTINTGHRSHFHYKWNRIPTVRESARLQTFPDDFIFYGNKSQQYRQVGNAVPPLLGKAVATQIMKLFKEQKH